MKKLILLIDIQNEYIADGRDYHIKGITPSLLNVKKLLAAARKQQLPIWHMQHKHDKSHFNKNDPLSDFIPGFEPANGEQSFIKNLYSCFSSVEFTQKIAELNPEEIIIMGYGSSMCCLCTIIDGIHRGYRFTLVEDATASRNFPHADENEMHSSSINVLKQYANVVSTESAISQM